MEKKKIKDSIAPELTSIITSLRTSIHSGSLDAKAVHQATLDLKKSGYAYDHTKFPPLPTNHDWSDQALSTTPTSLAEALLWKQGHWAQYQSFVNYYQNTDNKSKETDVVFYAFAKHLYDQNNPIYDQHTLRALLAIHATLAEDDIRLFRYLLSNKNGKWKDYIKSTSERFSTQDGYTRFVTLLQNLSTADVTLDMLDKLLMPLGKAIKDHFNCTTLFDTLGMQLPAKK